MKLFILITVGPSFTLLYVQGRHIRFSTAWVKLFILITVGHSLLYVQGRHMRFSTALSYSFPSCSKDGAGGGAGDSPRLTK